MIKKTPREELNQSFNSAKAQSHISQKMKLDTPAKQKIERKHKIHDFIFVILGIASASVGLKGFLLPNSFIDGGVTGISLIIHEMFNLPVSILLVIINIPFLIMGFSSISKSFAIRSIFAIIVLAISVHFVSFPIITEDKLLIAVFGGFFLGMGIGLSVRGGAVIDGTEVLAVFISKKTPLSIGDVIMLFNVVIFGFAAYVFTIEIALYAMLTYLIASKTVDFVLSGIEEYLGVTIISDESEDIRYMILEKLGRACTIYNGKKGYCPRGEEPKATDIVYTLITRLELTNLETEIDKIDPDAFVVMHSIKDAKGGMIKKRPLH